MVLQPQCRREELKGLIGYASFMVVPERSAVVKSQELLDITSSEIKQAESEEPSETTQSSAMAKVTKILNSFISLSVVVTSVSTLHETFPSKQQDKHHLEPGHNLSFKCCCCYISLSG